MAEWRIGDNLNADSDGRWFTIDDGPNGRQKNYVTSPFEATQNKIKEMYDAQQNSQLGQLKAQRDKAIGGFNQQKKDLAPQYQNQRNQADVVNAQNVSRLRELMAAQGINASGENLTTQANMASSRQNALGEINNNEQQAFRQIDNQIADWNDPNREQSIISDIAAQRSQSMFGAYQDWQKEMYQRENDWKQYQMQQEQWALEKKMKELEYQKALAALNAAKAGKTSTAKKATTTAAPNAATSSAQAFTAAKAPIAPLDQYYSQPGIVAGQRTGSPYFQNPVPPAQNPNLSAWAKMKMIGM